MAAIYGQARWLSHAPLTVPASDDQAEQPGVEADWLDILGRRTLADLARGVQRCEDNPGRYPPGAAEFRERCREFQRGTFAGNDSPARVSSVVELLEGATVTGSARAYIHMCQQLVHGEGLTNAQLAALPPLVLQGGDVIRPSEFCVGVDDEGRS